MAVYDTLWSMGVIVHSETCTINEYVRPTLVLTVLLYIGFKLCDTGTASIQCAKPIECDRKHIVDANDNTITRLLDNNCLPSHFGANNGMWCQGSAMGPTKPYAKLTSTHAGRSISDTKVSYSPVIAV